MLRITWSSSPRAGNSLPLPRGPGDSLFPPQRSPGLVLPRPTAFSSLWLPAWQCRAATGASPTKKIGNFSPWTWSFWVFHILWMLPALQEGLQQEQEQDWGVSGGNLKHFLPGKENFGANCEVSGVWLHLWLQLGVSWMWRRTEGSQLWKKSHLPLGFLLHGRISCWFMSSVSLSHPQLGFLCGKTTLGIHLQDHTRFWVGVPGQGARIWLFFP